MKRVGSDTVNALDNLTGYGDPCDEHKAGLACATFRPAVMTNELLEVQEALPKCQGMADGRVFFAGCWTNGAGLHEECFEQAERVVEAMIKGEMNECV